MATATWLGRAAAIKQRMTITVANTWAAADTAILTMGDATNGRALVVTVGASGTSTASVAIAIRDAIMATSRLTGIGGNTDNTSNFGGREFGEFSEIEASINTAATPTVVDLIVTTAGKPVTLTVTEVTAGTGTATLATQQAATGPNHWDAATNWSTGAVPANDNTVVFRDSNVSVLYGLPNGSNEVLILQYQSFTGQIGLPEINRDNQAKPYSEYRQRYVKLDEAGTGTALTHVFGMGEGDGSRLINVWHVTVALTISATVYNTGTPLVAGTSSLNLLIDNGIGAGGVVNVSRGQVYLGEQFGSKPSYATLNIAQDTATSSNADVEVRNHNAILTITQNGGALLFTQDATLGGSTSISMIANGGSSIFKDVATSGTVTVTLYNSKLEWNTSKTIATLIIGSGGIFDAEKDPRGFTATTCDLYHGASLLDAFARGTYSAGIDLNRCGIADVTLRVGNNRRLTLGTAS